MRLLAPALAVVMLTGCGPVFGTGDAGKAEPDTILQVEGSSMEPTLHCARPGLGCLGARHDDVVVRKAGGIERREIVAFAVGARARRDCGAGGLFVKRVVALAGERVSFGSGAVLVDGRPLREPYADGPTDAAGAAAIVVPPRHVYVLGDNRAQSCDSRIWGPLAIRRIVGVAVAVQRGGRRVPLP
ncbi:MAG TPA: signal peptidase I [Gaiellaceae bacterium]|nr:signal peptidase I [Gaiellaceae bacterium]